MTFERRRPRASRQQSRTTSAQGIERVGLRREIASLRAERASVSRFIAEANRTDDLASGLAILAEAARVALDAAGAALYLYSAARETTEAAFAGYRDAEAARACALTERPQQFAAERAALATEQSIALTTTPGEVARPAPDSHGGHWHTLTLPLCHTGQIVGCLQLSRAGTAKPYAASEISVGNDLAAMAGLIVGRLQQEALIRQRATRAEALREVGRQLSSELDFERFLDSAAAHLTKLLNVQECLLLTWNEETRELTPELYISEGKRQIWRVTVRPDEQRGLTGVVVNERRTIATTNYLEECRRHAIEPVVPPGEWTALAWVGLPLVARGQLIGVLVVERHRQPFVPEEIDLLESLAGQLAAAMENARLYAAVHQLATTDPLTGLANHRHIHDRLHQELERAIRHRRPLAVAMIDLDQFKSYNDTCGHQAGDDLLRAIADTLREELRASDMAGRYGGDEFLLLLPETTAAEALPLLERVRARLATLILPTIDAGCPSVTASAGVAAYDGREIGAHELIAQADAALYADKRAAKAIR